MMLAFRDVQCIVATEMHVAPMPNPVWQPRLHGQDGMEARAELGLQDQPSQYFRCGYEDWSLLFPDASKLHNVAMINHLVLDILSVLHDGVKTA